MFHEWRVYKYYEERTLDVGLYDKSNLPLTAHNLKLYTLLRTDANMTDFCSFIEVDMHDAIRDKKDVNMEDMHLQQITNETVFTRVQLRHYLAKYFPERMKWTGIDPVYNETRERDTHRYYWASKMAKDFVMLTGKREFTYHEV